LEKSNNDIFCPICGKIFGEWKKVVGEATILKKCPKCKKMVQITKKS